jgi:hypothetical protein
MAASDATPFKLAEGIRSLNEPAVNAAAITPSDTTDLTQFTRFLYVGGTGDVTVNMAGTGATILFKAIPVGTVLPIRVSRVLATGTTATNLVALW